MVEYIRLGQRVSESPWFLVDEQPLTPTSSRTCITVDGRTCYWSREDSNTILMVGVCAHTYLVFRITASQFMRPFIHANEIHISVPYIMFHSRCKKTLTSYNATELHELHKVDLKSVVAICPAPVTWANDTHGKIGSSVYAIDKRGGQFNTANYLGKLVLTGESQYNDIKPIATSLILPYANAYENGLPLVASMFARQPSIDEWNANLPHNLLLEDIWRENQLKCTLDAQADQLTSRLAEITRRMNDLIEEIAKYTKLISDLETDNGRYRSSANLEKFFRKIAAYNSSASDCRLRHATLNKERTNLERQMHTVVCNQADLTRRMDDLHRRWLDSTSK